MTNVIKTIFRKFGIRRYKLENFHYKLDQRFPTRFLGVWLFKPILIFRWLQNTFAGRTLLCTPEMPGEVGYELRKLAMILGVRLTRETTRPHLGMAWRDTTVRDDSELVRQNPGQFLNGHCSNIGKDRIEEVFEKVSGYALRVDPTTHRGSCVRKSVLNAKHDGVVLNCPIAKAEPGYVYQRLIDNTVNDGEIVDLRAPFYRDTLPVVYVKYRKLGARFADINDRVELHRTEEIFSREELELIVRFGRAFGLDYGGMDILRDNATRKLFIVDVNNTPFGPPKELSASDKRHALGIIAEMFHQKFIVAALRDRHTIQRRSQSAATPAH